MQTRFWFIFRWVFGTTIGWFSGLVVGFIIPPLLFSLILSLINIRSENPLFILIGLPIGLLIPLTIGFSVGFGQWRLALRNHIPRQLWLGISTLIGITSTIAVITSSVMSPSLIAAFTSGCSGLCVTYQIADTWLLSVLVNGTSIGLAIGIPQWLALRRYRQNTHWWIIANIAAGILTITFYVLLLQIIDGWLAVGIWMCLAPILFAFITGFPLYTMLSRQPKPKNDELPSVGQ